MIIKTKKGQRIPCYSCGLSIHKDHFGGAVKLKDGHAYTHDYLPCLLEFRKLVL